MKADRPGEGSRTWKWVEAFAVLTLTKKGDAPEPRAEEGRDPHRGADRDVRRQEAGVGEEGRRREVTDGFGGTIHFRPKDRHSLAQGDVRGAAGK